MKLVRDNARECLVAEAHCCSAPATLVEEILKEALGYLQVLETFELRNFIVPDCRFDLTITNHLDVVLTITASVPDQVTGTPSKVRCTAHLPPKLDPTDIMNFARRLLIDLLRHEIDEAFHVDGVRVFDPHSNRVVIRST